MSQVEMKQLKKSSFLEAVTAERMTRQELVAALEEGNFEYIDSYLDFLIDHFVARNKLVRNEDGTISRKVAKGAASRELFRVIESTDEEGQAGYALEQRTMGDGESYDDAAKDQGWATTVGAAGKKANSAVFQDYKDRSDAIKALIKSHSPTAIHEAEEAVA
jgi:hypothetical protein